MIIATEKTTKCPHCKKTLTIRGSTTDIPDSLGGILEKFIKELN